MTSDEALDIIQTLAASAPANYENRKTAMEAAAVVATNFAALATLRAAAKSPTAKNPKP